ncbi:hypothetical protein B0O99DRAFT_193320 [Bisporella sp. PMI_857]|nr:hypothetical protein B0O99DRAFT_193320 [Bisporella sp. PMI_857]
MYKKHTKSVFSTDDSRYFLNDLQTLLMPENCLCPRCFAPLMRPRHEDDIFKLRNFMNLTKHIESSPIGKEQHKSLPALYKSSSLLFFRNSQRCTTVQTRYARLDISFWDVSSKLYWSIDNQYNDTPNDSEIAARLSITPNQPVESPVRIVLDFLPLHHPLARITYQAMRPNDSEVFKIAKSGCINWLIEAIQQGTASLTDRDEEGRSLLNYAMQGLRPNLCMFLIQNGADVNAFELDMHGNLRPLFSHTFHNEVEVSSNENALGSECHRISLEADADLTYLYSDDSINIEDGSPLWLYCLSACSLGTCQQMLGIGKDYIPAIGEVIQIGGERIVPLMTLASYCGYYYGTTLHVVDKAIWLIKHGADIACIDDSGDTILHAALRCNRLEKWRFQSCIKYNWARYSWLMSKKAPKDLLIVFITAGADVYARNNEGETPSIVARSEGHENEWVEALQHCGFNAKEVLAYSYSNSENKTKQTSQLSLKEYCGTRKYDWRYQDRLMDGLLEGGEEWLELLSDDERAEMEEALEEEGTEVEECKHKNRRYDGELDKCASHRSLEDGAGERWISEKPVLEPDSEVGINPSNSAQDETIERVPDHDVPDYLQQIFVVPEDIDMDGAEDYATMWYEIMMEDDTFGWWNDYSNYEIHNMEIDHIFDKVE